MHEAQPNVSSTIPYTGGLGLYESYESMNWEQTIKHGPWFLLYFFGWEVSSWPGGSAVWNSKQACLQVQS